MPALVVLFVLLCLDLAGALHGTFSNDTASVVAIVLAIVAVVTHLPARSPR